MRTDSSDPLTYLLIRWHRWSANPMLCTDTTMREFDEIVSTLWPCMRIALIVEARNLSCGAAVWSSVRIRGRDMRACARNALKRALEASQHNWTGHTMATFNEHGRRIGESNPKAKLTDHEVDLIREMYDERRPDGSRKYSLGGLAMRMNLSKATVQFICSGRRRAQTVARVKEE